MSGCAVKPGKQGAETMSEPLVECLLQAVGDSVVLNTFDKQFRSGTGPNGLTGLAMERRVTPYTLCFPCRRISSAGAASGPENCGARTIGKHRMT